MTKREAERWANVVRVLSGEGYGISLDDIEALYRVERALHRWAERECNGEVSVDDNGKAWDHHIFSGKTAILNLEAGALRRLAVIMASYPHLRAYHQTDPRGCALYVYQQDKLDEYGERFSMSSDRRSGSVSMSTVDIDSCYSSVGVAICR